MKLPRKLAPGLPSGPRGGRPLSRGALPPDAALRVVNALYGNTQGRGALAAIAREIGVTTDQIRDWTQRWDMPPDRAADLKRAVLARIEALAAIIEDWDGLLR